MWGKEHGRNGSGNPQRMCLGMEHALLNLVLETPLLYTPVLNHLMLLMVYSLPPSLLMLVLYIVWLVNYVN